MMPCPIVTQIIPTAEELVSLSVLAQFLGFDADYDAAQDAVLPVLRQSAIELGEQITGCVWGAASYQVRGLPVYQCGRYPALRLPICPITEVAKVSYSVGGSEVVLDPTSYTLTPAAIELGRPWAELSPVTAWPAGVGFLDVECTAGWKADTLPDSLRSWILTRVATLYDLRQDVSVGSSVAAMPRDHTRSLLDRWTVRGLPYG